MKTRSKKHEDALWYLCERMTFEGAYDCAHGETEEERKAMAYRMLEALSDLQKELVKKGSQS